MATKQTQERTWLERGPFDPKADTFGPPPVVFVNWCLECGEPLAATREDETVDDCPLCSSTRMGRRRYALDLKETRRGH